MSTFGGFVETQQASNNSPHVDSTREPNIRWRAAVSQPEEEEEDIALESSFIMGRRASGRSGAA